MNTKGGNTMIMQIIIKSVVEMIMSFVDIAYKIVWKMSNTARRVNSLRLVTDVR